MGHSIFIFVLCVSKITLFFIFCFLHCLFPYLYFKLVLGGTVLRGGEDGGRRGLGSSTGSTLCPRFPDLSDPGWPKMSRQPG